jgi:hypothetical protein
MEVLVIEQLPRHGNDHLFYLRSRQSPTVMNLVHFALDEFVRETVTISARL